MLNCFALLDEKEFNRVLENEEIQAEINRIVKEFD